MPHLYVKSILGFFLLFASFFLLLSPPANAAVPGIVVEFEAAPLFSEANFLPDDSVTRFIKVTNNRDASRFVVTKATNISDPNGFASTLTLTIKEGATTLWSGTLAEFFAAAEVPLSIIASDEMAQYDFTVAFSEPDGNIYQEASLGFDILVGFQGEEAVGSEGDVDSNDPVSGGAPTGSGGINGGQGLVIASESALPLPTTNVLITWTTNHAATTRVIYGTTGGVFDSGDPPDYGYPSSTPEIDTPASVNGITNHAVLLTGLTPGTIYYYRVISSASPATVGFERSFAVAYPNADQNSSTTDTASPPYQNSPAPDEITPQTHISDAPQSREILAKNSSDEISSSDSRSENGTANVSEFLAADWPWWLWLLFLLSLFLFIVLGRKRGKNRHI